MRALGLRGVSRRKWTRTTLRDGAEATIPDLVERDFTVTLPSRVQWRCAVYLPLRQGGAERMPAMAEMPPWGDVANGPDIEGMRAFVRDRDRVPPKCFVGRRDVIDDLTDRLDGLAGGGATQGATHVVQGAPGAGKTAVMHELVKRWRNHPAKPVVAWVKARDFASSNALLARLLADIDPDATLPTGDVADEVGRKVRAGAGNVVGGELTKTRSVAGVAGAPDFRVLDEALAGRPLVLMVDEAQDLPHDHVTEGGKQRRNWSVAELHLGEHGLPILPVYFGLGTTRECVGTMGVSGRAAQGATVTLRRLSADDCRRCARETLRSFRAAGGDAELERWARACADHCAGWPQHLHNNLRGACMALVAAGGDMAKADLGAALAAGAKMRAEYYDERLGLWGADVKRAGGAVLLHLADATGRGGDDLWDIVHESLRGRARTDDHHARTDKVFRALLRAGVIEAAPGPDVAYECPIPTFLDYVRTGAVPVPPTPPLAKATAAPKP